MGKRKKAPKLRTGMDVTRFVERNNCRTRSGKGDHIISYLPKGIVMTHPNTRRELSPGMRAKVKRTLASAGLLVFVIGCMAAVVMGGF